MAERFIEMMNKLALPVISECGCELVDSEFVREGGQRILRFYIEKTEENIGIDDCAAVSRRISELIDEAALPDEEFTLEVSSPGVNRVLKTEKDYIRFNGSTVDVSLYKAKNNIKKFTAVLVSYEDGRFVFDNEGTKVELNKEEVAKINLHFDFKF